MWQWTWLLPWRSTAALLQQHLDHSCLPFASHSCSSAVRSFRPPTLTTKSLYIWAARETDIRYKMKLMMTMTMKMTMAMTMPAMTLYPSLPFFDLLHSLHCVIPHCGAAQAEGRWILLVTRRTKRIRWTHRNWVLGAWEGSSPASQKETDYDVDLGLSILMILDGRRTMGVSTDLWRIFLHTEYHIQSYKHTSWSYAIVSP